MAIIHQDALKKTYRKGGDYEKKQKDVPGIINRSCFVDRRIGKCAAHESCEAIDVKNCRDESFDGHPAHFSAEGLQ